MARRTKEEALETYTQLLDAAEHLFSQNGVTHTSLHEVAEAAGVTRGAIYHHFKNKLDLIDALMKRVLLPIDEMGTCQAEIAPANPLAQIRLRAIHVLHRAVSDPHTRAIYTILFHKCEYVDEVLPIKQRHLAGRNECATKIMGVFRAAIEMGQLPSDTDPKNATMGLFGFIDGLVYNWLLDPSYFALENNAEYFIDIYIQGLQRADSAKHSSSDSSFRNDVLF